MKTTSEALGLGKSFFHQEEQNVKQHNYWQTHGNNIFQIIKLLKWMTIIW